MLYRRASVQPDIGEERTVVMVDEGGTITVYEDRSETAHCCRAGSLL